MTNIAAPNDIPISVNYTGRDYYSLREQLISRIQERLPEWSATNPADFGVALVEAFAYMGDLMSYYIDRNMNEAFIATATQKETVLSIAQSYGYIPAGYRQAFTELQFTNSSTNPVTIPSGTVVSGNVISGDTVTTVYFTTGADLYLDPDVNNGLGTISATEGRNVNLVDTDYSNTYGELVGTSDGTPNQSFQLGQSPVVDGSLSVYVQSGSSYSKWVQVTHLVDYGPTDLVFVVATDSNDNLSINFGDGVSGAIPVNFSGVRVQYVVGGGNIGNVVASTLTTLEYVPGLSTNDLIALQSFIEVTNTSSAIGGSDPEDLWQIRNSAPLTLRANNRAVTLEDFKNLALTVPNCGKANATADVWTSVTVYVAPSRNLGESDLEPGLLEGVPTDEFTSLSADVSDFLSTRTLIGATVSIQPPTYVDVVLTVQYKKYPQYTVDEVESSIKEVLTTAYGYVNTDFGQTIYQQEIERTLNNNVTGIKAAKITVLHRDGGSGLATLVGDPDEIFRIKEENITIGTF